MEPRIDMRTREGRAMASAPPADGIRAGLASMPVAEGASLSSAAPAEMETPSGRRITRETRRGFGNQGQKLAYPERPGYHRHWFNDSPGRVMAAEESGYTKVIDPATKKPVTRVVGTRPDGGPLDAYLLEIPQEWFDDDMAALEEINRSKEEAIKGGAQARDGKDQNNFYNTAQGRKLEISRGSLRR